MYTALKYIKQNLTEIHIKIGNSQLEWELFFFLRLGDFKHFSWSLLEQVDKKVSQQWWFGFITTLYPTLVTPCSLPGSSVHGNFQARILEWVAISFSNSTENLNNKINRFDLLDIFAPNTYWILCTQHLLNKFCLAYGEHLKKNYHMLHYEVNVKKFQSTEII